MARQASPWLVETKTNSEGKVYKVYVLDQDGNRIPADTPAEKVAEIRAKPKEKKAGKDPAAKAKVKAEKPEKKLTVAGTVRKNRRALKRVIPLAIQERWFKNMKDGRKIIGLSEDGANSFMVLRHVGNWLLIHMEKKNIDKYFYYNPLTEKTVEFVKDLHKTGKGDESLLWPNEDGTEVNLREVDIDPASAAAAFVTESDAEFAKTESDKEDMTLLLN